MGSAAQAVGKVSSAMSSANATMDAKELQKTMNEFTKQNELLNIREEMMDDALADAFDNDEIEEEAEQVTNQVLEELGIELGDKMNVAPSSKLPSNVDNVEQEDDLTSTLPDSKARLDAL